MDALPTEWGALLGLVFALGLRHGLDADHVATIDALTRLATRPARARWCGALFAAGHGTAVLLLVAVLATASQGWQVPSWLAPLGAWISIGLLTLLGGANLVAAWRAAPEQPVRLGGLRGRWLARLLGGHHPVAAAAIGALFALSFDTVGLALMFAAAGHAAGGIGHAVLLALVFAAGMLLTDGVNGLWLARLLRLNDGAAARASRATAWLLGSASLAVAGFGAWRLAAPPAAGAGLEGLGPVLGLGLLGLVMLLGGVAVLRRRLSGRPAAASTGAAAA